MRPSAPRPPGGRVRVVLGRFDDLFGRGLRDLLDGDHSLELVAEDIEQKRIAAVLRGHRPDVAILDLSALGRLADVRELSIAFPSTRLVLLGDEPSTVECAQLLAFGASACLARATQARDVLTAVHLASRGLKVAPRSPGPDGAASAGGALLTPREAEVLPLLQRRRTNAQIASALGIGVETVRTHARNIYRKLGVCSRAELAAPRVLDRSEPTRHEPRLARQRVGPRGARARRGHDARRG